MNPPAPDAFTFTSPLTKPAPLAAFLLELAYPHPSDGSRLMLEIMQRGGVLEFVNDTSGQLVPAADGGYGIRNLGELLSPKERADALHDRALELEHKTGPGPTRVTYGPSKPHLVPLNSWQDAALEVLLRGRVNIATVRKGKAALWVPAASYLEGDPERPRPASSEIPWVGVDFARDDSAVVEFPRKHDLKYVPIEPDAPEPLQRAQRELTREHVLRTAKQIFDLDP